MQLFSYYSQQILNQISNEKHALHVKYVLQIQMYKKAEVQKMEQFCQVTFITAKHSEPKLKIPFRIVFEK